MRISDWSSDVCSSDLLPFEGRGSDDRRRGGSRGRIGRSPLSVPGEPNVRTHVIRTKPAVAPGAAAGGGRAARGGAGDPPADGFDRQHAVGGAGPPLHLTGVVYGTSVVVRVYTG